MDVLDSDADTTDGTDRSLSDSVEAFTMNSEQLSANEQSNGADSAEEQWNEGLPVTEEELERKAEKMEAEVRRLKDEERLMKQMLSSAVTRSQLEKRLNFYKLSGLYVSKFTDSKLRVDVTPMLHGRHPGYFSYYVQFRIISEDCFRVEKGQLPSSIIQRLHNKQVSLDELGRLLGHLQHVCQCTNMKMKQFTEAEKDPRREDEAGNINVNHTIFTSDNLHVEVGFQPADQKFSHLWMVVLLLYNENEIIFEPQGVQVQSEGFSKAVEQSMTQLFMDGCDQELKFIVWKAKNLISNVLERMTEEECLSENADTLSD